MARLKAKQNISATADLGTLQKELQRIADGEQRLREEERQLAQSKAEVEKQLTKTLKYLGILDIISPRNVKAKAPAKPRAAGAGTKRKARAGSKRYSDDEKQAAVQFVQSRQAQGITLTQAIKDFNSQQKPRGKAQLNYQNYKRWAGE